MILIAHGCAPSVYPINSVESASLAKERGADLIEMDVKLTKDKKLAVTHERNLDVSYGVSSFTYDMTGEEFRKLTYLTHPNVHAATLDDFFAVGIAPILIHLGEPGTEIAGALVNTIKKYGYENRVVVGTSDYNNVFFVRRELPGTKILGFIKDISRIEDFVAAGADAIRLWQRSLTEENVSCVKNTGAELWVMSGGPQTPYDVGRPDKTGLLDILKWEPDGILIDDLEFVKSVLAG